MMSYICLNRWNNLLMLTCHPYGILLTADIFSTDISSLRDFLFAQFEQATAEIDGKKVSDHFIDVNKMVDIGGKQHGRNQKSRRDDISVKENGTVTIKKSRRARRDDISVEENSTVAIKKSRKDDISVKNRWNNLLILTCHPYGILLTANIFSTDISSLRDFLSYTNKRVEENGTFTIKKSRRDDMSVEENSTFAIKKSRRDDISVEENGTFTIKKSRRDDISVEENGTFAIKKSRRDDISVKLK